MQFKFEPIKKDYSDFSSDKLLVNAPRTPAFPVRVASEIMARSLSFLSTADGLTLYDPCCGGGHLLTVLGFCYSKNLKNIYGSDIDIKALEYAQKNLSLLTPEGLSKKKKALQSNDEKQDEKTQLEALNSAKRLEKQLFHTRYPKKDIQCFHWDITRKKPAHLKNVNIVMTDLPYGKMSDWQGAGAAQNNPNKQMLNNIYQTLDLNNSIVTIICNKQEKINHQKFEQVKRLKHGKRQFIFLRPLPFY